MSDLSKRIAALPEEKRKQLLAQLNKSNPKVAALKMERQDRSKNSFPLSFAQQRLWFLDQLEPNTSTWNIPIGFRLTGNLNEEALQNAILKIVERHEVLRTTFAIENGQPVQVIQPTGNVHLSIRDLTRLSSKARNVEFHKLAKEESGQPFSLATGPLFRPILFRLSADQYCFLLIKHHIISDAWSIGLYLKELRYFYNEACGFTQKPLPEIKIQYADFSVWQREWLRGSELQKQISFWKELLGSHPPVLQLPLDKPRPSVQTFPGEVAQVKYSVELCNRVRELAKTNGATMFMALLSAFKILMQRYSGQDDIVVGSPIAGRNRAESEALVGFFVNNMVLRTDLSGDPTFLEVLSRVKKMSLSAYAHQDLPFEKLVEELQPDRDLSLPPLFQVLFVFQNAPVEHLEFQDVKLRRVVSKHRTSRFDLTLYMAEKAKGPKRLVGVFEYNTDLFEEETIRRMISHLEQILWAIVEKPEIKIANVPLLSAAEFDKLIKRWNETGEEYSDTLCFQQLFEKQVAATPDAVAAEYSSEKITYLQLNKRANQLAIYLQDSGIGGDDLVGICMERSIDMLVALLAVMKAGAGYVPADPAYPKDRITYMLEDAKVSALISESKTLQYIGQANLQCNALAIDVEWPEISRNDASNLQPVSAANGLAYVIYTSGSTGRPKGVAISHQALINFLTTMQRKPGLVEADRLLAVTTLSFDIAGLELYLPLLTGATVVIASREISADGRKLASTLDEAKISIMQATPATWRMLLDAGWTGDKKLKALCGGEAMPRDLAEKLVERTESLWNMYGPTETTIWSAVQKVDKTDRPIPIGKPIGNTKVYILDKNFNPVPTGIFGELYIGGDGLARGYLHRSDLTAEKFIPNPFAEKEGARMYATGDSARFFKDGSIDFVGRLDHQVKVRGFRIELGEIESSLVKRNDIDKAVVIVREDKPGDKRLVGYLIASGSEATLADLRTHLLETLPEYMLPSAYVYLDAFPMTSNGKIDRKSLPAPESGRPELGADYVAPKSELERAVALAWEKVLDIEKVGVNDNFFDLGGHSLLLVQVQTILSEKFRRDFSILDFFRYPTIETLAQHISAEPAAVEDSFAKMQDMASKRLERLMQSRTRS